MPGSVAVDVRRAQVGNIEEGDLGLVCQLDGRRTTADGRRSTRMGGGIRAVAIRVELVAAGEVGQRLLAAGSTVEAREDVTAGTARQSGSTRATEQGIRRSATRHGLVAG